VSEHEIEVDRAKIEVIEQLPPSTNLKGIAAFWDMWVFTSALSKTFLKSLNP
jgi:hypothetical protein